MWHQKKPSQQHTILSRNAKWSMKSRVWYTAGAAHADRHTGNDGRAEGSLDENPEDKVRGFLASQMVCSAARAQKLMRALFSPPTGLLLPQSCDASTTALLAAARQKLPWAGAGGGGAR